MAEKQETAIKSYADSFLEETRLDILDISKRFFRIGFRLAEANEQKYYKTLGYDSIEALAEAEFEFKRSTTYGLMRVWECYHDRKCPMQIESAYEKFSYTKLLEISKERYCGAVYHIDPDDSVRDIREYIRYWNKLGDRGSHDARTLKEWKKAEQERKALLASSEQLEIECEEVQTFGQTESGAQREEYIEQAREAAHQAGIPFYEGDAEEFNPYVYDGKMSVEDYKLMHKLLEEDLNNREGINEIPDELEYSHTWTKEELEEYKESEDPYDMPMQTHSYDSDYSPEEDEEEQAKPIFKNREDARSFYRNYLQWEKLSMPFPMLEAYMYSFKIGSLFAIGAKKVRYFWQGKDDKNAIEMNKRELDKFLMSNRNRL